MRMLEQLGKFLGAATENGRMRLWVVITFSVVVGLVDSVLNWYTSSLPLLTKYLMRGFIVSGLAALFCWVVLEAASERRLRVNEELERAARLNHHIRNALEVITSAGYLINDKTHGPAVVASVNRIDRVLKEEYPGPERRRTRRPKVRE
jgi:hypothetical protein